MRYVPFITVLLPLAVSYGQQPTNLGARLDSALIGLEAKGFSGAVRIEKDGSLVLEKGYGLANRADHVAFSPATVVQIGSNTKDFTVVALLQLQERGSLDVKDSLGKYFPTAPADKRGITLWQLVTHRAGFPIGLGGDFESITRRQLVDRAMQRPLGFPPGSAQAYSNTGYSLLAAIIEMVSGKPYDEYIRDNILLPLGMRNTGLLLPGFDEHGVAHGYRAGDDSGTMLSKPHAADGAYWNLRGNGGMLSTLDDMHTFYNALFEGNALLKPATRNMRFRPDEPVALAGSDLVSSFLYERDPAARIELIIASNTSEFRERPVRGAVAHVLGLGSPGVGPVIAAKGVNIHPPEPAFIAAFNEYIRLLNAADTVALRRFIDQHFIIDPGTPSVGERVTRMVGMHGNLGELTIVGLTQTDPATIEASLTSQVEGPLTMKVLIDGASPPRIKGIQVLIGG